MNHGWRDQALREFEQHRRETPFVPGDTAIPPSGKIIGATEIANLLDAIMENVLTEGPWVTAFEQLLAAEVGVRFASMCNSGSSANLLAMAALTSHWCPPHLRVQRGEEVLTTAVGFPTTLAAILHAGLRPAFIDIELETYVPSRDQILNGLDRNTAAVFMAHTLGNPFSLDVADELHDFGAVLIEDNCDALGSTWGGKRTGSFGALATQSFYPAHHITTGEGGAVLTNLGLLRRAVESIRDWGRDCWCEPGKDATCGKRFGWTFEGLPDGYDHKYVYSEVGYSLKSTDLQAAIGLAQLERLGGFTMARAFNFNFMWEHLADLQDYIILPRATEGSVPSWFGFPITLRVGLEREPLLRFLAERRIGTRNLFGGNLLRQPAFRERAAQEKWRVVGDLAVSDIVTSQTFWIGCWPGLSKPMLTYMVESLHDYFRKG